MPDCPHCARPLRTTQYREGLFFVCPDCQGRAVTLPQLRRVTGDRHATALLRQMNRATTLTRLPCPFCRTALRAIRSEEPPLELESCKPCGVVWFDPLEFEAAPEAAVETPEAARLRAIEIFARRKLENQRARGITDDGPDADWKIIPALLGFPVESGMNPVSRLPWVTWGLAAVILVASVCAFFHPGAVAAFGLVPAEFGRRGGLTLLTSFFLHGGVPHLLGNLYFLLVFGDNVEDFLGRGRYALLLLAAALAGDFIHILADPRSTTPAIGASGGISGVIVFYALQFPRARLLFLPRYFLLFRWVEIPAWGALALWLLLQTIGVAWQLAGFSNVAATAHLGGAAAGFVVWCFWKRWERRPLLGD